MHFSSCPQRRKLPSTELEWIDGKYTFPRHFGFFCQFDHTFMMYVYAAKLTEGIMNKKPSTRVSLAQVPLWWELSLAVNPDFYLTHSRWRPFSTSVQSVNTTSNKKTKNNAAPIMRRITIFFMLRASKRLPPNKPFFVSRAESWSQSQQLSGGGDVSSNRLILSTEGTSCTVDVDCGCLRKHCVIFHSYFSFGAKCVFDLFTLTFDLSNLKHCLSLYVYAHLYT